MENQAAFSRIYLDLYLWIQRRKFAQINILCAKASFFIYNRDTTLTK